MEQLQTADLVREELEKEIFIMDALYDGLINYTALARKLLPKIKEKNKKATVESISIAIKRHIRSSPKTSLNKLLKEIIAASQISIKDNIAHITYQRNETTANVINEASKNIKWDLDEICLINQGPGEITIIIDEANLNVLNQKKAIEIRKKLALLTIKEKLVDEKYRSIDIPGLYAYFVTQLSKKGVNIQEVISTSSQISFLIDETDLTKAYEILKSCVEYCKK